MMMGGTASQDGNLAQLSMVSKKKKKLTRSKPLLSSIWRKFFDHIKSFYLKRIFLFMEIFFNLFFSHFKSFFISIKCFLILIFLISFIINLLSLLNNLMKLKICFIILFALTYLSQCKSFMHK